MGHYLHHEYWNPQVEAVVVVLGPQIWKSEESRLLHRLPVLDIDLVNGLAAVVLHLILAFSCLVDFEVVLDFEFFVIVGSIVVDGALDSEDRDWIGIVRLGARTWSWVVKSESRLNWCNGLLGGIDRCV